VVFDGRAYAFAGPSDSETNNKLVAVELDTGEVAFETVLEATAQALDSWSSPAADVLNGAVIIGSGPELFSVDAETGAVNWSTTLARQVVNASAVVAEDLEPGRVFITDYDPFGGGGSLYCVNTSPFDAGDNPYQRGDIVWQELLGKTSGNTPAYHAGVVYVTSISAAGALDDPDDGHIHAFDVDAPSASRRLWSTAVAEGFFGGVTYVDNYVYAAGYNFNGGPDNSTLVKMRAADGAVQWTAACERTASIPIVAGERIYLSAGILGYGSVPKVQAFEDHGAFATKLWDTYVDTGGTFLVGGWTHQPMLDGDVLYVGKLPQGPEFFGPYTDLFMLDTTRTPDDPGFVIDHLVGMGSSPACASGRIYTIGIEGLWAVAARGDFCGVTGQADGAVDGMDLQCFVAALLADTPTDEQTALGDFNEDSQLTIEDVPGFLSALLGP
jgi:outer membrane protein assembly factor BamB